MAMANESSSTLHTMDWPKRLGGVQSGWHISAIGCLGKWLH